MTKRKGTPVEPTDLQTLADDVPALFVGGDFLNSATTVKSTTMSMILGVGEVDGERLNGPKVKRHRKTVFAPFVSLNVLAMPIASTEEEEGAATSAYQAVLPLDNAAYLLWDLSLELGDVLEQLKEVTDGSIKPEAQRIRLAKQFVSRARVNLARCDAVLESLADEAEDGDATAESKTTDGT